MPSSGGQSVDSKPGVARIWARLPVSVANMADLRKDWPDSRRRHAAARGTDVAPAPAALHQAGVSNHLLARALLQRVFQFKGKEVPSDAKVPKIHGAKAADLQKLADDKAHDYGAITDAGSVAAAMQVYEARHRVVAKLPPLDETYAGYRTVWNDDAFAERDDQTVRATFQLDSMQGKHDSAFAADKDARKKAGGQQMPPQSDYAALAQRVPAALARERLDQIFNRAARVPLDFSVQREVQEDGYHYEISARWAPLDEGLHLLVYYHCYPPY